MATMKEKNGIALRANEKWPGSAHTGFQIIPNVLFKNQKALGLNPTDVVVLLNLTMHWHYQGRLPYPRSNVLARHMGVNDRTIQRSMSKLRSLQLISSVQEVSGGETRKVYNFSGLIQKLKEFSDKEIIQKNGYED